MTGPGLLFGPGSARGVDESPAPGSHRGHGIPESNQPDFGHVRSVRRTGQPAGQAPTSGRKIVTRLIILGQFVFFQGILRGILFYAVFWLVPNVCMYPMILRLKTITEHFDRSLRKANTVNWIARTSYAGWLQNHLVGARMEFHFEHHVLPTIPYRGLKKLHRQLRQTDLFLRHGEVISHGYILFLTQAVISSFGGARVAPRVTVDRSRDGEKMTVEPEIEMPPPVLDMDHLERNVERLLAEYQSAAPYPHIVIDDFLEPAAVRAAMAEAHPSIPTCGRFIPTSMNANFQYRSRYVGTHTSADSRGSRFPPVRAVRRPAPRR